MAICTKNLEFWMTNLPSQLKNYPIIYLAIPGSHDSTTYAIQQQSGISPDARPPLQYLKFLRPFLGPIMLKWSKTQLFNVTEQLNFGVRYFDLRIATKPDDDAFYFVHNMYSEKVIPIFDAFVTFLNSHPEEIIILDCQHFFRFNTKEHERFVDLIFSKFREKLLPYMSDMKQLTIKHMTQLQHQIILIYRDNVAKSEELLWPSETFQTPWPNTLSPSELVTTLDDGLKTRNFSFGYVSQCVLTPNIWYVCRHIFGSLKDNCFLPLEKYKYYWLKKQIPGKGGINIVISDFVHTQEFRFSKEVITLNGKIFNDNLNV